MTSRVPGKAKLLFAAVLIIGGVYQARSGVLDALKAMNNNKPPSTPFDLNVSPAAPDYTKNHSWVALPDTKSAADATPMGVTAGDQDNAKADVFFVYPTVFFSRTAWNASIDDAANNARIDELPMASQASAFNGCCAIYAPRYRQMTLGGFVKWSVNSEAALELAYGDVSLAFDEFLRRTHGRPFIIAGHSQGSRLARRLIAERIDGTPLTRRLVAGYLIGAWIEQSWFTNLRDIRACTSATDKQCVVTWSTYEEGRRGTLQRMALGKTSHYAPESIRRPYVCINPVTWSTDEGTSPIGRHLGAWLPDTGKDARAPQKAMITARCKDGAVYVSTIGTEYAAKTIPFGNLHNLDYNLFYMDIRANAIARVAAFELK